ncbi:MAG: hypothetical protein QM677_03300 [Microbacterium sp.]
MTIPGLAPRNVIGGIVAVCVTAAVVALAVGLFVPSEWVGAWMPLGFAGCLIIAFVVQLRSGHPDGFLRRMGASALGALVVMGLVGMVLGVVHLFGG